MYFLLFSPDGLRTEFCLGAKLARVSSKLRWASSCFTKFATILHAIRRAQSRFRSPAPRQTQRHSICLALLGFSQEASKSPPLGDISEGRRMPLGSLKTSEKIKLKPIFENAHQVSSLGCRLYPNLSNNRKTKSPKPFLKSYRKKSLRCPNPASLKDTNRPKAFQRR